ncbi:GNAT family N-acetyltransferase [Oceanisphaera avium]|nr:GNAT family N-acetyltransferase [Oceanisphaera avium]
MTVSLTPLRPPDIEQAAALCAEAMLDNPLHIRVFGNDAMRRKRRLTCLFNGLLPYILAKGELMGAYDGQQLQGVLGRLAPHSCQPNWQETVSLAPALISSNSPLGWLRTLRWLSSWAKLDPSLPHWHLGPLAVAPQHQRQGIGRTLIEYAIREANEACLYLETDKLSNVQFYQSLGFTITATLTLLGIQTWLMQKRKPSVIRYMP